MNNVNILKNIIIEKPAYGGSCIARHNGKTIFIEYGIPGEIVDIEIIEQKKDYDTGIIIRIIQRSPHRIDPPCKNFSICGGCSYLHTSYDNELDIKKNILIDSLERIAGLKAATLPEITMIKGDRFNYRSHASIKYKDGKPGFYQKGTNNLTPFGDEGCMLIAESLNTLLTTLTVPEKIKEVRIAEDYKNVTSTSLDKDCIIEEKEHDLTYRRNIHSFFQGNRYLRGRMLKTVRDTAEPGRRERIIDAGCGIGFFTLYLARDAGHCNGYDIDEDSIAWGKSNARLNNISNTDFSLLDAAKLLPGKHAIDTVVVDPPRAGLSKKARQSIIAIGSPKLVYVSCNPATFSRDAKDIIKAGFRLEKLTLIDMFPCTHHIEVIAGFKRTVERKI